MEGLTLDAQPFRQGTGQHVAVPRKSHPRHKPEGVCATPELAKRSDVFLPVGLEREIIFVFFLNTSYNKNIAV